jgi:hypothetical protein
MTQAVRSRSPDPAATQTLPLSLLRIWCRKREAWLSFTTHRKDRYLIGKQGYYIELPDATLAPVSPRVAFPVVERFPAVRLSDIEIQSQFGSSTYFVYVPDSGPRSGKPRAVELEDLALDLNQAMPWLDELDEVERYVAIRIYDSGLVSPHELGRAVSQRHGERTLGQTLLETGACSWEHMLAVCLDTRSPTKLDPPALRALGYRKEWELTGEILLALGKITRTHLESALKIKRDGSQALGEILTSMGACSQEDIEECLRLQKAVREHHGSGVGLVGQLLVSQGVISPGSLEEALRCQRVGRQSLEKILLSMGACTQRDIDGFVQANNWHSFQGEIDDIALGHWLVKLGTISRQQLDEALRIQTRGRQVLGEMLVSMRFCTNDDIEGVLQLQKDLRRNYASGLEKLGSLLIKQGKIDAATLDRALSIQSIGRQPIGAILVAMEACSADDVQLGLELQRVWRENSEPPGDRLGEVLIKCGALTYEALEKSLPLHLDTKQPLGRILVEQDLVAPEAVIDALVERDRRRQEHFRQYLKASLPEPPAPPVETTQAKRPTAEIGMAVLNRLTSWITKRSV